MQARKHPEEVARLAALRAYDILDTPREADFDDVVNLASRLCDTPISVINLVDAKRQWFKAETGLGVRETPLETSFCAHAILENDFVEIPDLLQDDRMQGNPLTLPEPGMRFYAGALLKADNGLPIGTLCVLDTRPRELSDLQRSALRVLAAQVTKQLKLRVALRRLEVLRHEADHRIKNSLAMLNSLIRLQLRGTDDAGARSALATVQSRVATIGALHSALSGVGDGTSLPVNTYLSGVVDLLRHSLPGSVALTHDFADCDIATSQAANLAMIVNEWVMNAIKHGFPADRIGKIRVSGQREGDFYSVTVTDDGVGMGSGKRPGGIGFAIVAASAAQMDGTIRPKDQDVGTAWTVRFPVQCNVSAQQDAAQPAEADAS